MTEEATAALGYPAGPLDAPAMYWRAPRFPLLHADPDCAALRDWRTGCWPGSDGTRPAETPQEIQLPVAAVLTGAEPACPCVHRLPEDLHAHRLDGQLLADLRAHRTRLQTPGVGVLIDALLLAAEVDETLPETADPELAAALTTELTALQTAAEAARATLLTDPRHRAELLARAVVTNSLGSTDLSSLATAAARAGDNPVTDRHRLGQTLEVDHGALSSVRSAWTTAYAATGEFTAGGAAARAHADAGRLVLDRSATGRPRPVPTVSRAHLRHMTTVWETAVRAAESLPPASPAELVAFPDWQQALVAREHSGPVRDAVRRLFAASPVLRLGDAAVLAVDPLELAAFDKVAGVRELRRVPFGPVPAGNWQPAAALTWQLWTSAGGLANFTDPFFADSEMRALRQSGTLADPYTALATAVGVLAEEQAQTAP